MSSSSDAQVVHETLLRKREESVDQFLKDAAPVIAFAWRDGVFLATKNDSGFMRKIRGVHECTGFAAIGVPLLIDEFHLRTIRFFYEAPDRFIPSVDQASGAVQMLARELFNAFYNPKVMPHRIQLLLVEDARVSAEGLRMWRLASTGDVTFQRDRMVLGEQATIERLEGVLDECLRARAQEKRSLAWAQQTAQEILSAHDTHQGIFEYAYSDHTSGLIQKFRVEEMWK